MTLQELFEQKKAGTSQARVGLIAMGGGLRVTYTAGVLRALELLGYSSSFDEVYGASGGALVLPYMLGRNGEEGIELICDELTSKRFVDLRRKRKKMDIDFLVDHVIAKKHPIDFDTIRRGKTSFFIALTEADTGKPYLIEGTEHLEELYKELKATAALPVLYDKAIKIYSRNYIDGAISQILPLELAAERCDVLVVILTRTIEEMHAMPNYKLRHLVRAAARHWPESVRDQLPANYDHLRNELNILESLMAQQRAVLIARHPNDKIGTIITNDRKVLRRSARLGMRDGKLALQTEVKTGVKGVYPDARTVHETKENYDVELVTG